MWSDSGKYSPLLNRKEFLELALYSQAAVAAGKPYMWAIDAVSDCAGGVLFAHLLNTVNGCVAAVPARRLTVPYVLDALTTLQHDVTAAALAASGSGKAATGRAGSTLAPTLAPTPPSPAGKASTSAPTYDVLAIIDAMEALGMDPTTVIDAIGGMRSSSLDVLRIAGVPYVKCVRIKQALASVTAPKEIATEVIDRGAGVYLVMDGCVALRYFV